MSLVWMFFWFWRRTYCSALLLFILSRYEFIGRCLMREANWKCRRGNFIQRRLLSAPQREKQDLLLVHPLIAKLPSRFFWPSRIMLRLWKFPVATLWSDEFYSPKLI